MTLWRVSVLAMPCIFLRHKCTPRSPARRARFIDKKLSVCPGKKKRKGATKEDRPNSRAMQCDRTELKERRPGKCGYESLADLFFKFEP